MKLGKRLLTFFLSVVLLMTMLGMTALAAGSSTNVEFTVDKSTAAPGETITVTFSNKEMKVSSFTGGIEFDKSKLECVSIVGPDSEYPDDFGLTEKTGKSTWVAATAVSSKEQANNGGTVGFAYAGTADTEYAASKLYTATFKVKEGASDSAKFTLYEDSDGTNEFRSTSIESKTVTISGGSETPAVTKYTVTFDANGGGGTMTAEEVEKAASGDTKYSMPLNGFTEPAGKEFYIWQIGDEFFAPGCEITLTGDITATAVWKTSIASVNFTMSGYELGKTPADIVLNTTNTNVGLDSVGIYTSDEIKNSNELATGSAFEADKDYYLFVEVLPKDGYIISQNANKANFTLSQSVETRAVRLNYGTVEEVTFKLEQLSAAEHTHSYGTWVPEVPATCMADGVKGHYTCDCGKNFDADKNELTSLTIAKNPADHATECVKSADWSSDGTNHWHAYSLCGAKADEAAHSYTVETAKAEALKSEADCQSAAVYYKSCVCGKISTNDADTFISGEKNATKHAADCVKSTEWKKDATYHWHELTCGAETDKALHSYGTDGKCVCGAETSKPSKATQTIEAADVTATYGDTDRKVVATAKTTLSYAVKSGDAVTVDGTTGELTIVKAGEAVVTVTAAETDEYAQAAKDVKVTVAKKEIEVLGASSKARPYKKGDLSIEIGSVGFTGLTLEQGKDYTVVATVETDTVGGPKDYTIDVTLIGDVANNYTLKKNPTTWHGANIYQAEPTVPTGLTGKKGDALSTVALTDGWSWVNGTTIMTEEGEKEFAAKYVDTEGNYKTVESKNLTVKVTAKATQTIEAADVTATYGDTGKKVAATTAGNGTLSYAVKSGDAVTVDGTTGELTIVKAGEAVVTVTAAETADYASNTKDVTVKVAKKELTVTAKDQSIYVNGTLPDLTKADAYTVTGLVGTDTVTVTLEYQKDGAAATPDVATAGNYDIVVTAPVSLDNYEVNAVNGALTISKRSSGGSGHSSSGAKTSYTITVDKTSNGSVSTSVKSAVKGDVITVTVKADKGYELDALTVVDKNNTSVKLTEKSGKYTFTMPASKVTVKGSFVAEKVEDPADKPADVENPFTDVPSGAYYEDAVLWAAEEGITGGTTATTFSSDATCTRAQAVAFLWRAAGCPAPTATEMPFVDVAEGSYYYNAVLWAIENGITKGTSETTFGPDEGCTRAQIVTFLWRSQKSPVADTANPFVDVAADAYYADAVLWAVKADVTNGTTNSTFGPDENCTRAQIVTFIYRCMK